MKSFGAVSILFIVSITLVLPNAYAEEWNFFDWLTNLFGVESEKNESDLLEQAPVKQAEIKRAAIIDQLERDFPNHLLQNKTISYFEDAGYEVDLYKYEDITIDFYKNLPSMDYNFIVIRSHALAIYGDNPSSWIFTGEKYSEKKYISEQLAGDISRAVPYRVSQAQDLGFDNASKDRHFIVSAKFVKNLMTEKFPNSVIILGGCDTMALPDFGHAFIERGASSVIGWNGLIDSSANDKALMSLVEKIIVEKLDIDDAVNSVTEEYQNLSGKGLRLKHYASGIDIET